MSAEPTSSAASAPTSPGRQPPRWRRWAFAAVPAVGLLELFAHAVQARGRVHNHDWIEARDYVAARASAKDLIAFAPRWADPIGREFFGPGLATLEREARPDESRFPLAYEVSLRGEHVPSLRAWRRSDERRFGSVTVTKLENPEPANVLDDLVSLFGAERMAVTQVQGRTESTCALVHGVPQSGGLGFGPAVPGERFVCPSGGFVGVSVVADLDYVPRRCLFAPPTAGAPLRVRFSGVRFGRTLHGHHGLYVEAERGRQGAPVTISFSAGDALVGSVVHRDGEGWKPFEFETSELAGKTADLVAEIATSGDRRMYCFEADTR